MIGFSGIRGSVKHSLTSRIDKGRKEIISFLKKHVTAANYKVTPTVPRTRRGFYVRDLARKGHGSYI